MKESRGPAVLPEVNTLAEWDLIQRCRKGNSAAYELLVNRYQREAFIIARSLLLDSDEAADAVQDSFVRAWRSLGRLAEGSTFGPWFRTIVRNHCIDRLRSPNRKRRTEYTEYTVDRHGPKSQIRDPAQTSELTSLVRSALEELSSDHREILVLKEMEGLNYAEIAEALKIPDGTVASRLFHARAALKRVLLARGITAEDIAS